MPYPPPPPPLLYCSLLLNVGDFNAVEMFLLEINGQGGGGGMRGPLFLFRARICKRLRGSGIDFASLCILAGRYVYYRVVVPGLPARLGIDSWAF
jgi:hypothetical protein